MKEPLLVSIVEAGRLLAVGRSTLYALIREGYLKTTHIGRRQLVTVASIKRLAKQGAPMLAGSCKAARLRVAK